MTFTVCYSSKAIEGLNDDSIQLIFASTQQNNYNLNITGILLYNMGSFFQVLEGEERDVMNLYENIICKDPRHEDIFEIIKKPVETSVFSNYSSIFNVIQTTRELENVNIYLKKHRDNRTSEKIERLLKPFFTL